MFKYYCSKKAKRNLKIPQNLPIVIHIASIKPDITQTILLQIILWSDAKFYDSIVSEWTT
jgi:hypothetical protein